MRKKRNHPKLDETAQNETICLKSDNSPNMCKVLIWDVNM